MIGLRELDRTFRVGGEPVHAIRNLTLQIASGEYVAIMGPSGSGKSTLLNILGLLDRPDRGEYLLDGIDTTTLTDAKRAAVRRNHVGFVFQSFHLIPRLSAYDNIALPMMLAGIDHTKRRKQVQAILESLGLENRATHLPNQLSGGQHQRVAIARATIMEPTLLLADEPTGNLDKKSGEEVMNTLETLNNNGITLLVVTHDPNIGDRARRCIRMVDGAVADDRIVSTDPRDAD